VLPVAQEFGDDHLGALARAMYGRKLTVEGQIARAIAFLEPAVSVLEGYLGMDIETARTYSYLAIMLAEGGRGRASLQHLARLQQWIEDQGDLAYPRLVEVNCCFAFVCACDFSAGLRSNQRAIEFAEKANEPLLFYVTCDLAAWLHCRSGDFDTALSHRQRALEVRARHGSTFQKELFDAIHAEILLRRGDIEAARALAEEAATAARADGSLWALPFAERTWGWPMPKPSMRDSERA
jgi:tetratricopeptide (TPR) repeat protein